MNCEAFLDAYTEYRDGLLDDLRLAASSRFLSSVRNSLVSAEPSRSTAPMERNYFASVYV